MRLACPNCDVRYEVPDDAIPIGGREAQCTNCGHSWFQQHPDREATVSPPRQSTEPTAEPQAEDEAPFDGAIAARRPVEESVLTILREEAAREQEQRRLERETKTAPPSDNQNPPESDGTAGHPAPDGQDETFSTPEPQGATPEKEARSEDDTAGRRTIFPDVEKISTILQPDEAHIETSAADARSADSGRTGSFRAGFLVGCTLFLIATGIYIAADRLSETIPAVEKPLEDYVNLIGSLGDRLNGLIERATALISGQGG